MTAFSYRRETQSAGSRRIIHSSRILHHADLHVLVATTLSERRQLQRFHSIQLLNSTPRLSIFIRCLLSCTEPVWWVHLSINQSTSDGTWNYKISQPRIMPVPSNSGWLTKHSRHWVIRGKVDWRYGAELTANLTHSTLSEYRHPPS